MEETHF